MNLSSFANTQSLSRCGG